MQQRCIRNRAWKLEGPWNWEYPVLQLQLYTGGDGKAAGWRLAQLCVCVCVFTSHQAQSTATAVSWDLEDAWSLQVPKPVTCHN